MKNSQIINTIKADARTVRQILDTVKYEIDFFQREYKWGRKQIEQLISDLETKFKEDYDDSHHREQVANYSKYYLGSIILSIKNNRRSIIDGQQRLTSMTLLLIYLNNLQKKRGIDVIQIDHLIVSEKYSKKSFNLDVDDRRDCIDALFKGNDEYEPVEKGESVKNIKERYDDILQIFPEELKDKKLPYFIDWLIDNVIFVEIQTPSDDDAYTIFETMNDRGLNLSSTEMLKGYLLSAIPSDATKQELNELWKDQITDLKDKIDKHGDLEFFKAWLRAKYADTTRIRKKGAENEDFEKIAIRFHIWVRDNKDKINLKEESDFYNFIKKDFEFYSRLYLKIHEASNSPIQGLEYIYHIEAIRFPATFYFPLLMAPIETNDDDNIRTKKMALVARYLETYIVFRSVNFRTLASSSIRYIMFSLIRDIRNMEVTELAKFLKDKLSDSEENLGGIKEFGLHQQNKRYVQFLLARMTHHIEEKSGISSNFQKYFSRGGIKPFEIEHIWSNKFEDHKTEFEQREKFDKCRNLLGALILVPRGPNQSYGQEPYESKLRYYYGENLLAKSLSPTCYAKNPSFLRYNEELGCPFKPHEHFGHDDILNRQKLYQKICEDIWNLDGFDAIVNL